LICAKRSAPFSDKAILGVLDHLIHHLLSGSRTISFPFGRTRAHLIGQNITRMSIEEMIWDRTRARIGGSIQQAFSAPLPHLAMWGQPLYTLPHPQNANLLKMGALAWPFSGAPSQSSGSGA
jgi:hypothetical protein